MSSPPPLPRRPPPPLPPRTQIDPASPDTDAAELPTFPPSADPSPTPTAVNFPGNLNNPAAPSRVKQPSTPLPADPLTLLPALSSLPASTLSPPNLIFSGILALLAYFRISPFLILLVVGAGLWLVRMAEHEEEVRKQEQARVAAAAHPAEGHHVQHAPHFVNHAVAALWPIINDAIFAPVIDLLEDALQAECPGIIHSIRVDSLSQGSTPLEIKFMRPISDEEWFAGLERGREGEEAETGDGELGRNRRRGRTEVLKGANRAEGRDEDLEGGDYSCFEVCFDLANKGKKIQDRAGLLIYFGVGVKGLGGIEARESH